MHPLTSSQFSWIQDVETTDDATFYLFKQIGIAVDALAMSFRVSLAAPERSPQTAKALLSSQPLARYTAWIVAAHDALRVARSQSATFSVNKSLAARADEVLRSIPPDGDERSFAPAVPGTEYRVLHICTKRIASDLPDATIEIPEVEVPQRVNLRRQFTALAESLEPFVSVASVDAVLETRGAYQDVASETRPDAATVSSHRPSKRAVLDAEEPIVVNLAPSAEDDEDSGPHVRIGDLGTVLQLLRREPPPLLFHYTSVAGLKGILESRAIWATDIAFLNDATEVMHANDLTSKAIDRALKKHEASQRRNPHLLGADSWVERFYSRVRDTLVEPRSANVFVTSFSENGDQLSQWRGYSAPGAGYALGFDGPSLRGSFRAAGMHFGPCIYDQNEQRLQIARLVETAIIRALRFVPRSGAEQEDDIARGVGAFGYVHASVATMLKHPSFSEECEWRAFSTPTSVPRAVQYRSGPKMLIPFSAISLGQDMSLLPLREIVVGPTPHPELAATALERMLASLGLSRVLVRNSRSPLRWD